MKVSAEHCRDSACEQTTVAGAAPICECDCEVCAGARRPPATVLADAYRAIDKPHQDFGDRAFCGFMAEREPKDWPPGHYFVTLKQVTWSSGYCKVSIPPEFKFEPCAECVRRAEESTL